MQSPDNRRSNSFIVGGLAWSSLAVLPIFSPEATIGYVRMVILLIVAWNLCHLFVYKGRGHPAFDKFERVILPVFFLIFIVSAIGVFMTWDVPQSYWKINGYTMVGSVFLWRGIAARFQPHA